MKCKTGKEYYNVIIEQFHMMHIMLTASDNTEDWEPVDTNATVCNGAVISGKPGLAAASMMNKAFSSFGNFSSTETVTLSPNLSSRELLKAEKKAKSAAKKAERAAKRAEKILAASASRRRKKEENNHHETFLNEITSLPVAFNIGSVIILIIASTMITER